MIDKGAFHCLSYGIYIVASQSGAKRAGCVVNTFQQITSSPLQVSIALNKDNETNKVISESKRFTAVCLTQEASMELIGAFGFHSSSDRDKLAECKIMYDEAGIPYISDLGVAARFSVRVVEVVDVGTHTLFIGEVEESEKLSAIEPMTYAFYHQVKGGKTPPKASSYLGDEVSTEMALPAEEPKRDNAAVQQTKPIWRCSVCGHEEYLDKLPSDYACPICGVDSKKFRQV